MKQRWIRVSEDPEQICPGIFDLSGDCRFFNAVFLRDLSHGKPAVIVQDIAPHLFRKLVLNGKPQIDRQPP